jgi:hypothetical protein
VIYLVKVTGIVALGTGVGLAISEVPSAPTRFSQFVHTKSGLGRGYDCEIGDMRGKLAATTCQHLVGRDKFLEVAQQYSETMILDQETLDNILKDPEIREILSKRSTLRDRLYRQLFGFIIPVFLLIYLGY